MNNEDRLSRALHDLGAAAWFGGSLMGAIGVTGASRGVTAGERVKVAADGRGRWSPVAVGAIGAHAMGSLGLTLSNRGRSPHQPTIGSNTTVKTVLTLAAVASTAYSGILGAHLRTDAPAPVTSGTVPSTATPDRDAKLQQQLRVLQWVTPMLTGTLIVLGSQQGRKQKAARVLTGTLAKATRRLGRP